MAFLRPISHLWKFSVNDIHNLSLMLEESVTILKLIKSGIILRLDLKHNSFFVLDLHNSKISLCGITFLRLRVSKISSGQEIKYSRLYRDNNLKVGKVLLIQLAVSLCAVMKYSLEKK